MPKTIARLQNAIQHQEAVELTIAYVAEMLKRLPALEEAIKTGPVRGASPMEDVKVLRKGLTALAGWFGPQEAAIYKPSAAALKAELANLPPEAAPAAPAAAPKVDANGVCTLPVCAECSARPSPPDWSTPLPYRYVHARPVPPVLSFDED